MKSKNVLIVDDNALNRRVFEHIIGQVYNFDIAQNGKIALEKLKNGNFDLVLMDIQMPVMDGITAMKKIRNENLTDSPIIAISAYAEQNDKDYFLSTGFSDFIAKPIKPKLFLETISQHLKEEIKIDGEISGVERENLDTLDEKVLKQLQKYNSIENIHAVYTDFIEETESLLHETEQLLKTKDYESIGEKLHIIKGNSGTLGAQKVYNCCKEFEKNIKNGIFDNTLKDYLILRELFDSFKTYINQSEHFNP
ncbi:CheY chemotaxis protein or a CheY-like REC (receiver) domain [Belliella buryatensis]|uniref:CheY chemotaxis protein or a CheY-like REC (Receiver) domain n=1 Tax=Belliella buryatensis TaxID=1500549 RepID=A0A239CQU4_9BACT|nr:response regulator [Belliella buryatensis]SNS21874.1 CheY chemotaxis protein or a CheY-like REC (receiver) domain [Belliella buryatensis]